MQSEATRQGQRSIIAKSKWGVMSHTCLELRHGIETFSSVALTILLVSD